MEESCSIRLCGGAGPKVKTRHLGHPCIDSTNCRDCTCAYVPSLGRIQRLPAFSASRNPSRCLTWLRSASSSSFVAHGKAALNIPVADTQPSLLLRYNPASCYQSKRIVPIWADIDLPSDSKTREDDCQRRCQILEVLSRTAEEP